MANRPWHAGGTAIRTLLTASVDVAAAVTRAVGAVPIIAKAVDVVLAVVVVMGMALTVATPGHGHGSHKCVFFFIVMFCVQPCSCRCARPSSRLRSSGGNCGSMVCNCGNDKVKLQL